MLLPQAFESPSSLGNAKIQPPQEVGLRGRGVTFGVDLWCCWSEMTISLMGKHVSAVIGCSVFKKKMVRPRPQTSVTLLWPNPCWSFAIKYIPQLVPHQEQELAMRPFFIIVFVVLKRQWRRGACRRNYNTASARLKQNSALSLFTRAHTESQKNLHPTVAIRSRKVENLFPKLLNYKQNKEAQTN